MSGGRRISDRIDRQKRIIKLYDHGLTHAEIADNLHMSHDAVKRALRGHKRDTAKTNVAPAPYARGYKYGSGLV